MASTPTQAREALAALRALVAHWREDKAHGLTPTDGSFERALQRLDVIEAAVASEMEAA